MRKGKKQESQEQVVEAFAVREGYEKRYVVDHEQTETFAPVPIAAEDEEQQPGPTSMGACYHIALGAKETLKSKLAKKDVRVRLRLRSDRFELQVKVPKEVKKHVAHVAPQTEVLQAQA